MQKKVVIIGGGIIGLCSAYYLHKEGHAVTLIDQSPMNSGASYVNAGYLSPSHIIPLSAPGVVKKGLKWMFNASSPLYVKPQLNLDFMRWAWAFNQSCTSTHVNRSAPVIRDISLLSQELYQDIISREGFSWHYEKKGLLMICQTEQTLKEELDMMKMASELGLEAKEVSPSQIKQIEPHAEINTIGGTFYKCDHHSTPGEFMTAMKTHLKNSGIKIHHEEAVLDMVMNNHTIKELKTTKRKLQADAVVLAAGSWSGLLGQKIGLKLLLQAGKGYCINTKQETGISVPAILCEAKAAVTPMNGFTRFAGTMEIATINHNINHQRVEAIARAAERYYPTISLKSEEKAEAVCGLRPVSPDGLPYIGISHRCKNLIVAAGHAMMGWSMGSGTGLLVSEIVSGKKTSMDLLPFHPDRGFG